MSDDDAGSRSMEDVFGGTMKRASQADLFNATLGRTGGRIADRGDASSDMHAAAMELNGTLRRRKEKKKAAGDGADGDGAEGKKRRKKKRDKHGKTIGYVPEGDDGDDPALTPEDGGMPVPGCGPARTRDMLDTPPDGDVAPPHAGGGVPAGVLPRRKMADRKQHRKTTADTAHVTASGSGVLTAKELPPLSLARVKATPPDPTLGTGASTDRTSGYVSDAPLPSITSHRTPRPA